MTQSANGERQATADAATPLAPRDRTRIPRSCRPQQMRGRRHIGEMETRPRPASAAPSSPSGGAAAFFAGLVFCWAGS